MRLTKLAIVVLFFTCSCSVMRDKRVIIEEQCTRTDKGTFFVSVPIAQFTTFQSPCVKAEIEGKKVLLKLDLGFQGDASINQEIMNDISLKQWIGEKSTYGVRGKEYKKKSYQIPKLKIGAMAFTSLILQEENGEFLKDAEFLASEKNSTPRIEEGRLGWTLFYNANLLIDVQNSQIAFCDSLDTLKKKGYPIDSFIRAPLFLERGLAEFEANTPEGPLRCVLDTGSTWNVLNVEPGNEKLVDSMIWSGENVLEYPSFIIDGVDFGSISFYRVPVQLPIRIDAILGMDFFKNHLVFLDFSGKAIYFLQDPVKP